MPRLARPIPFYPVLLAAYAGLFLWSTNVDETVAADVLPVLAVSVAGASLALVAAAFVTRDWLRAALIVGVLEALFFGYRSLALLTRDPPLQGLPTMPAWVAFFTIALFVVWRRRDLLPSLTRLLNIATGALIVVALVIILPHEVQGVTRAAPDDVAIARPPAGTRLPDIYFLVFDRYGSERSLETRYGITEHGLVDWLEAHGFYVAHDSHANYHRTGPSLEATLNMAMLDGTRMDIARLGDHAVGRYLTSLGYRYVHIGSWFGPTQSSPLADENLGLEEPSDFARALYHATLLPSLERLLGRSEDRAIRARHRDWATFALDALEGLRTEPGPKFVFAHLLLPHPPYVFDRDGNVVSGREAGALTRGESFLEQKLYLDQRLEALLGPLLELPEAERPIIIVQADEGPYPVAYEAAGRDWDWTNASDDDITAKFGILNAQYWPGTTAAEAGLYPTISPVNTFRLLFDHYFDAGLPLLPDRTVAPSSSSPGGVVDLTDRLPGDR
jgi:hypothetical protein